MPTVACKECGKMVSPTAATCPHCGVSQPGAYLSAKVIFRRKSQLLRSFGRVRISMDGKKIGELADGHSMETQVPCGVHQFHTSFALNWAYLVVTIEPSKVYQIESSFATSGKLQLQYHTNGNG